MNWSLVLQLIEELLPVAARAVQTVEQSTGKPTGAAIQEVVAHLTPGAPQSDALSESAPKAS
jgi:hypothetical protein